MKFCISMMALIVAIGVSLGGMRPAYGELVFEDDLTAGVTKAEPAQAAMPAAQVPAVVPQTTTTAATAAAAAPSGDPTKDLAPSELMRRSRLRQELKNEDLLTQKLEELRLKDEMKRTDMISSEMVPVSGPVSGIDKKDISSAGAPLPESRVGSVEPPMMTAAAAPATSAQGAATQAAPSSAAVVATAPGADDKPAEEQGSRVTITPRAGTAGLMNAAYNVQSRYSFGFGVALDLTDYIAFTGGYTFSKYNIGSGTTVIYPMSYAASTYFQTLQFNDNTFELGARAYLTGIRSKARPYLGGGGAYRRGFVNYDDTTLSYMRTFNPAAAADVNVSGFAGYLETGLDFRLTKAVGLTGAFRYFSMLSSGQLQDASAFAYYGDPRSQAGYALGQYSFYQLMGGVSVTF